MCICHMREPVLCYTRLCSAWNHVVEGVTPFDVFSVIMSCVIALETIRNVKRVLALHAAEKMEVMHSK